MGRFSIIPASAVIDQRLSLRDLSVLAAIGLHTDRDGWCYPTLGRIGDLLGITRQAVQKSMRVLCDCGYVETRARRREDGGQAANRMRVLYDTEHPADAMRSPHTPATPEVAPPATPEVAPPATPEVAHNVPLNDINPNGLNNARGSKVTALFPQLPEWVPRDAWDSWWSGTRRRIRAPNTPDAMRLNIITLDRLRAAGHDPRRVIEQSIEFGYRGLFAPKGDGNGKAHGGRRRESDAERIERVNRELDEFERSRSDGLV